MRCPPRLDNGVVQDLLRRKSELDQQYAEAVNQYGPNYPKVSAWQRSRRKSNDDLADARKTMVESIQEEYNTARSHVGPLQEALDKQKAEANDLAEKTGSVQHSASTTPTPISSFTTDCCKS